jgi:hypothetical protein
MKTKISSCLFFAAALTAFASIGRAQIVQFNATITGAQETPANGSASTGTATMLYDVATNTFDLFVTVNNFPNTLTNSHIHEGAVGVAGGVATPLGAEPLYTRSGNTLTGSFYDLTYGGTAATLLQNGAYINFHSAAFPGGEIRGQLLAQPKRLVTNLTVAQEQAAFPTVNMAGLNDYGAAVMSYNSGTGRISLRVSVYNFNTAMNNSHFHEGAPGVSGAVVTALGNASNAGYTIVGNWITGTFDIPYTGDPIKLLTGGAYINFHSTAFPAGECRGQVRASDETPGTRLTNISTRGFVGPGNQILIEGLVINGPDPVRLLITAKGPSLTAFGVTGALADPSLAIYDSAGRQIAANDNVGTPAAGSELALIPGVPTNAVESALLVVLPPGVYSLVVSGNGGSGIALLEATDLRTLGTLVTN